MLLVLEDLEEEDKAEDKNFCINELKEQLYASLKNFQMRKKRQCKNGSVDDRGGEESTMESSGDDVPNSRKKSRCDWNQAKNCIHKDYLGPNPIFKDNNFKCIFRIDHLFFEELLQELPKNDPFFQHTYTRGINGGRMDKK